MEEGVGVNSPEFLQKKIERLKTALDEANVLMDRQVGERDQARAQLDAVKRENEDLKRQLAEGGGGGTGDAAPAIDPALEKGLRDRIDQLESERDSLTSARPAAEQELQTRISVLQAELDSARRDRDESRRDAESARADAAAARAASTAGGQARRPSETELPEPGPFVSQEVIRDALDNNSFVLFCQPVFSLQSERVTQYELLLRLRDADGRLVRPFSFLEPADRFGLISEIDRWVVSHALDILARDPAGDLRLEVNIAGPTISDPELTSLIEQQIAMTDLDPARLILEVSENVAAANLDDCERLAKRLRGLGCGFALDDFGSTFASFRHLRDIPVNYLKIDGDLVVTVTESRTGQLTIKSLVELAKGLGAETIAEYVSDDQTLEFLREQGVGYAQGYRIGRPRPIEEVIDMQHTHEPPKRVERPALGSGEEEGAEAGEGDHDAEAAPIALGEGAYGGGGEQAAAGGGRAAGGDREGEGEHPFAGEGAHQGEAAPVALSEGPFGGAGEQAAGAEQAAGGDQEAGREQAAGAEHGSEAEHAGEGERAGEGEHARESEHADEGDSVREGAPFGDVQYRAEP